jgi:hypothetical protein
VLVLEPEDRQAFDTLLASYIYGVEAADDPDLVQLASYAR